jgi:hypothetical protein
MNTFRIQRKSGTYAELLEVYGVANLLSNIMSMSNIRKNTDILITVSDDSYYEVKLQRDFSEEELSTVGFFPLFKYIKQKIDADISSYPDAYDYPTLKARRKERQNALNQIYKDCAGSENKTKRANKIEEMEQSYSIPPELDVITQLIAPNSFASFDKLYQNFFVNREHFALIITEILKYYSEANYESKQFNTKIKSLGMPFEKSITATQLYNPSQGQGVNKVKADGLNRTNFKSSWITETMKISGAISDMICQLVKVGNSYDLKVFVPEYMKVKHHAKSTILKDFKKYLKGNTPIKIDILNIILLTKLIIVHRNLFGNGEPGPVKNIISGLHAVYQKDLGQNKAVINIGFLQVPCFIEIGNEEENETWISILEEQRLIISGITELGDAMNGLLLYRNFFSGSDINSFFKFMHWYAIYLSTELPKKRYIRFFSIESLNKFYKSMDTKELNLSEIIANEGFKSVAEAIRRSTVSLQYTPKEQRKYEVRYGVAQILQTKSKSKEDLASFVGDFIATYNAETARDAEKRSKGTDSTASNTQRPNVRADKLEEFYLLLDRFPSRLVGALLASYGFALPSKLASSNDDAVEENITEGEDQNQ